jgi:glycosyltransferase involved in cell wall biosynthesis
MKRIAILHYAGPPVIGGVESTIFHHAGLMVEAGYEVMVIAGRGEPFAPKVKVCLIPLLDSKHRAVLAVGEELARGEVSEEFHRLQEEIEKVLRETLAEIDTCIVHNAFTLHKNLALTAALHRLAEAEKPRFIAWCHDFAWLDPLYQPDLYDRLPWNLLKKPVAGVRYVVVSEARRELLAELLGLPKDEITVVNPGVEANTFLKLSSVTQHLVTSFDLLAAAPLLLLPTRLTRRKNIELAIRVVGEMHRQGAAARLVITGPPGPHNPTNVAYLKNLRRLGRELGVEEQVIFLYEAQDEEGKPVVVSDEVVADLYRLADALFFPSFQEGFGIPMLEAGLARSPIFCADIPPLRETGEGLAHFFPPDGDPAEIARLVVSVLQEDKAYHMRHRILRGYTWSRIWKEKLEPLL